VRALPFWKYHGTGNDFVVVEAPDGRPDWLTDEVVRKVCDRHFGVGADGILLVEKGRAAAWFMRVLNADGSEAEMCGNGIRCVARHLRERLGVADEVIPVETLAGVKPCRIRTGADGAVASVAVGLGAPILQRERIPMAGAGDALGVRVSAAGRDFTGNGVSMGNPHFVIFEGVDIPEGERYGALLSTSPLFPRHANVEFAEAVGEDHFRVVVYERGCAITMACGTGAGATAVAAVLTGRAQAGRPVRIDLPGGPLTLTVAEGFAEVTLEGPAVPVFQGTLDLDAL
jgi:diaminopimelate epimerase